MRLFIATPITIPFYQTLITKISPYLVANFTKGYNLHLTHLFIGKEEPKNLKFNLNIPNEPIQLNDFDFFDEKILYLKAYSKNIDSIYKQLVEKKLIQNPKPFKPHVTIARIKKIKDKKALTEALDGFKNHQIKTNFDVFLYSSTLTPSGPIYKKIYKY